MAREKYTKLLSVEDVLNNIKDAFEGMDGDEIAEANNSISCNEIEYVGDSQWRYKVKKDE